MAYPSELVERVATVLGIPTKTVSQHDRILAINGYRSLGGRGRSAAKVNPVDAANLLIAVLGSPIAGPSVKETSNTFDRYAGLKAKQETSVFAGAWPKSLKILRNLPVGHSFRDALAELISIWTDPPLSPAVFDDPDFDRWKNSCEVDLAIELHGPEPGASISIKTQIMRLKTGGNGFDPNDFFADDLEVKLHYNSRVSTTSTSKVKSQFKQLASDFPGDLKQIRFISDTTVSGIGKLFAKES